MYTFKLQSGLPAVNKKVNILLAVKVRRGYISVSLSSAENLHLSQNSVTIPVVLSLFFTSLQFVFFKNKE